MNGNEQQQLTKAGLSRALEHLDALECLSEDELFERLGIMTNEEAFVRMIYALWRLTVSEVKNGIHGDILRMDGEG